MMTIGNVKCRHPGLVPNLTGRAYRAPPEVKETKETRCAFSFYTENAQQI